MIRAPPPIQCLLLGDPQGLRARLISVLAPTDLANLSSSRQVSSAGEVLGITLHGTSYNLVLVDLTGRQADPLSILQYATAVRPLANTAEGLTRPLQSVAICFFSLSKPETLYALTKDWAKELKRCAGAGEGQLPVIVVGVGGEGERREIMLHEAQRTAFNMGASSYRELPWPFTQHAVRSLFTLALTAALADNEEKTDMRRRLTGDHTLDLSNYSRFRPELLSEHIAVSVVTTLILKQLNLEIITFENLTLPFLLTLDLSHNKLKTVPQGLLKLRALANLDLSFNAIKCIDYLMEDHPGTLKSLDLRNNLLTELPIMIHRLPVDVMRLAKNPLNGWDDDLLRMPTPELFRLLAQVATLETKWNQIKISVVGEEGVGKSSLVRALLGTSTPVAQRVNNDESHSGIELRELPNAKANDWRMVCGLCKHVVKQRKMANSHRRLPTSGLFIGTKMLEQHLDPICPRCKKGHMSPDTLSLSFWTFSGQVIFYLTHQFFMSDRGIYLVVVKLEDVSLLSICGARIDYWLRQIAQVAPRRPPIFFVATHRESFDDVKANQILKTLVDYFQKRNFPNIKGAFAVSCTDGSGIEELRRAIISASRKTEIITQRIPLFYITLKKLVQEMKSQGQRYTLWSNFWWIASRRCGSRVTYNEVRMAVRVLHDAGDLIYVDVPESRRRDFVVFDPQWLSNTLSSVVLASVLDKVHLVDRRAGIVTRSALSEIWAEYYPRDLHQDLLSVITRFGIAHELTKVIFPGLLTDDNPNLDLLHQIWPRAIDARSNDDWFIFGRSFQFKFMPVSFFSKLVTHILYLSPNEFYVWKAGLAMRLDKEHVVKVTYHQQRYQLRVVVRVRKTIEVQRNAGQLKNVIDAIEFTLLGSFTASLESVQRTVECSHCLSENIDTPTLFTFRQVIGCLRHSPAVVMCRGKAVPIEVIAPDLALADLPLLDSVVIGEICGRGSFGQIWKAKWAGRVVAVKELLTDSDDTDEDEVRRFLDFQKEITIQGMLKHPHLLALYGLLRNPLRLVEEYAPYQDLHQQLHRHPGKFRSWPLKYKLALDIARGMRYLHAQTPPIIHRDLRSPNVFLFDMDESAAGVHAKVADFGLAAKVFSDVSQRLDCWQWLAPECFSDGVEQYSTSADVYSFAVVMWEIAAAGQDPFTEYKHEKWSAFEFQRRIAKEESPLRPTLQPDWPEQYCDIIRRCWATKPSARPSFRDAVRFLVNVLGLQDSSDGPAILRQPSLYSTFRSTFSQPPSDVYAPSHAALQQSSRKAILRAEIEAQKAATPPLLEAIEDSSSFSSSSSSSLSISVAVFPSSHSDDSGGSLSSDPNSPSGSFVNPMAASAPSAGRLVRMPARTLLVHRAANNSSPPTTLSGTQLLQRAKPPEKLDRAASSPDDPHATASVPSSHHSHRRAPADASSRRKAGKKERDPDRHHHRDHHRDKEKERERLSTSNSSGQLNTSSSSTSSSSRHSHHRSSRRPSNTSSASGSTNSSNGTASPRSPHDELASGHQHLKLSPRQDSGDEATLGSGKGGKSPRP